jgi:hypothetical protein
MWLVRYAPRLPDINPLLIVLHLGHCQLNGEGQSRQTVRTVRSLSSTSTLAQV